MTSQGHGLHLVPSGVAAEPVRGFEVGFVDPEAGEVRRFLPDATAVASERVAPIRSIPSFQGQRNNPGLTVVVGWVAAAVACA
ncbi:hypothetical protein [Nocardia sp. NPDC004260]